MINEVDHGQGLEQQVITFKYKNVKTFNLAKNLCRYIAITNKF